MTDRSATELLDCDGQAFGEAIGVAMTHRKAVPPELIEPITQLRSNLTELLSSREPGHVQAVKRVNAEFRRTDQFEYDRRQLRTRKIGNQGVLDWLAGASDKDIAAFAHWNVERRRHLAASIEESRPELIDGSLTKAEQLVANGLFPKHAVSWMRSAAERYSPFSVMDSFESGILSASGYFNKDIISLANLYVLATDHHGISPQLERTTFHELMHAAGFVGGGGFSFHPSPLNGRVWEEAYVAHSTAVAHSKRLTDPQPEVIIPADRSDQTEFSYTEEREILGGLSTPALSDIPVELWGKAFFDKSEGRHQNTVLQKLRVGFDIIDPDPSAMNDFVENYEATWTNEDGAGRAHLLRTMAHRILRHQGIEVIETKIIHDFEPMQTIKWVAADVS
jgi:hypothetical protein